MAFRKIHKAIGRPFASFRAAFYGEFQGSTLLRAPLHIRPHATAPSDPAEGDIYYDSDVNGLLVYDGAAWRSPAAGGALAVAGGDATPLTLTAADSGTVVIFDKADGVAVTLPTPAEGLVYDFYVLTSVTSNAYSITAGAATHLFIGGILSIDTDTADAITYFAPDGSDDDAMSMNGSTTGGLLGSHFRFVGLSATRWLVSGTNRCTGDDATPFA